MDMHICCMFCVFLLLNDDYPEGVKLWSMMKSQVLFCSIAYSEIKSRARLVLLGSNGNGF